MRDVNIDYDLLIGVDETGVGDYFTPVISVSCFIPKTNLELVKELGVKDSKLLKENKIIELASKLKTLVKWKSLTLSQAGYNKLISAKINNNEIKTLIHSKTINNLLKVLDQKVDVLVDQYTISRQVYENHLIKLQSIKWLDFQKPNATIYLTTKAESKSLAVASASIIARSILLEKIKAQREQYNFNFSLGASKKIISEGLEFAKKFGLEELKKVSKFSFKITKEIIDILDEDKLF
ncbi:ribonuclease HII [Metamycoplasma arthritidis]|uniref:Ribonuclease n=1 Tax=Metamycoplasma arthritidis (strain 158L3-1) TaxID=243272 RepID=B3PM99_META1|nr:ribonuclease HIII [Metamycoplasma arthritidis]ACF07151.1 ribonuclease HIII [Metamycoplasma arthritidis 158L3-1]VEU78676.1 ribonuclease HII [Metamycoplasma arthritidis]